MKKPKNRQKKARLTLLFFVLMLLAGVGNLLWIILKNSVDKGAESGGYLSIVATSLFILSSLAGIVITVSNLREKP